MSGWNHAICDQCWFALCEDRGNPGLEPVRLAGRYLQIETCCFCSKTTDSGIYVRHNPNELTCKHADPGCANIG